MFCSDISVADRGRYAMSSRASGRAICSVFYKSFLHSDCAPLVPVTEQKTPSKTEQVLRYSAQRSAAPLSRPPFTSAPAIMASGGTICSVSCESFCTVTVAPLCQSLSKKLRQKPSKCCAVLPRDRPPNLSGRYLSGRYCHTGTHIQPLPIHCSCTLLSWLLALLLWYRPSPTREGRRGQSQTPARRRGRTAPTIMLKSALPYLSYLPLPPLPLPSHSSFKPAVCFISPPPSARALARIRAWYS